MVRDLHGCAVHHANVDRLCTDTSIGSSTEHSSYSFQRIVFPDRGRNPCTWLHLPATLPPRGVAVLVSRAAASSPLRLRAHRTRESIGEQTGNFVLIFFGALIFAWMLVEWDSLWVPFALHACMNMWWDLFSVSRNVVDGWFPFTLQQLTMLLVIVATFRKRLQRTRMSSTSPSLA